MEHSRRASSIAGLTVLILVLLTTIPTSIRFFKRTTSKARSNEPNDTSNLYQDEDGIATAETQKAYTATLPTYLALSCSVLGFSASVGIAIYSTAHPTLNPYFEHWLSVGTWVRIASRPRSLYKLICLQSCLIIQTLYIAFERDPVKRYKYGCLDALACALLTAATCIHMVMCLSDLSSFWAHDASVLLDGIQLCTAVICCLACLSLPRRPTVEEGGTPVDGQYTASAFGRYTFFWAGATLVLARKKKTLGLADLPKLHVEGRSAYRQEYLSTLKSRDQLWKTLLFAHLLEFLFQTIFVTIQSATQFVPQLVLYQLLKHLESRSKGVTADREMWGLVITLGLALIFTGWTRAWLSWIVWARLGHPVRVELSAMIFGKATRRKDVKGVHKPKQTTAVDAVNGTSIPTAFPGISEPKKTETQPMSGSTTGQAERATTEDAAEEDIHKSRQSTINLVVRLPSFIRPIEDD